MPFDHGGRALSIRQPFAELILRGVKTIEFRSWPTRIIGERFWIYATKGRGMRAEGRELTEAAAARIWSDDLAVTAPRRGQHPPAWMLELAKKLIVGKLPTGVIVGSAVIEKVTRRDDMYEWHLTDIERSSRLRKPENHPQPSWFYPF